MGYTMMIMIIIIMGACARLFQLSSNESTQNSPAAASQTV